MNRHLITILISIIAGLGGGFTADLIARQRHPDPPQIAAVDVRKILLDHNEEITKLYPAKELMDTDKQLIVQDARDFANSMAHVLTDIGKGRTLIVKEAVIGNVPDLTHEVADRVAMETAALKRATLVKKTSDAKGNKE